jgi:hypothetical protein
MAVCCAQSGAGFGEIIAIAGRKIEVKAFLENSKMRMGMARGGDAENILTCGVEFPILGVR